MEQSRVTLNIKTTQSGDQISQEVELTSTVGQLKALLTEQVHIPVEQQRLVYKGIL